MPDTSLVSYFQSITDPFSLASEEKKVLFAEAFDKTEEQKPQMMLPRTLIKCASQDILPREEQCKVSINNQEINAKIIESSTASHSLVQFQNKEDFFSFIDAQTINPSHDFNFFEVNYPHTFERLQNIIEEFGRLKRNVASSSLKNANKMIAAFEQVCKDKIKASGLPLNITDQGIENLQKLISEMSEFINTFQTVHQALSNLKTFKEKVETCCHQELKEKMTSFEQYCQKKINTTALHGNFTEKDKDDLSKLAAEVNEFIKDFEAFRDDFSVNRLLNEALDSGYDKHSLAQILLQVKRKSDALVETQDPELQKLLESIQSPGSHFELDERDFSIQQMLLIKRRCSDYQLWQEVNNMMSTLQEMAITKNDFLVEQTIKEHFALGCFDGYQYEDLEKMTLTEGLLLLQRYRNTLKKEEADLQIKADFSFPVFEQETWQQQTSHQITNCRKSLRARQNIKDPFLTKISTLKTALNSQTSALSSKELSDWKERDDAPPLSLSHDFEFPLECQNHFEAFRSNKKGSAALLEFGSLSFDADSEFSDFNGCEVQMSGYSRSRKQCRFKLTKAGQEKYERNKKLRLLEKIEEQVHVEHGFPLLVQKMERCLGFKANESAEAWEEKLNHEGKTEEIAQLKQQIIDSVAEDPSRQAVLECVLHTKHSLVKESVDQHLLLTLKNQAAVIPESLIDLFSSKSFICDLLLAQQKLPAKTTTCTADCLPLHPQTLPITKAMLDSARFEPDFFSAQAGSRRVSFKQLRTPTLGITSRNSAFPAVLRRCEVVVDKNPNCIQLTKRGEAQARKNILRQLKTISRFDEKIAADILQWQQLPTAYLLKTYGSIESMSS